MPADYKGWPCKGLKGACWYTKTLALNTLRRGLILGRYTLACWQKQKVNRAMRRLGDQFFQALERGETNPLVGSEVSDAVKEAKDLKEVKDKNYQAVAAIRDRIRAAWGKAPPPPPTPETPPVAAGPVEAAEKPEGTCGFIGPLGRLSFKSRYLVDEWVPGLIVFQHGIED